MFLYNPPHTLLHIDVESKKCQAIIPFSGCHYLFSLLPKEKKIQLGASTVFLRPVTTRKDTPSRSEGQQEPGDRRNTATDYMAVTTAVSIRAGVSQAKLY